MARSRRKSRRRPFGLLWLETYGDDGGQWDACTCSGGRRTSLSIRLFTTLTTRLVVLIGVPATAPSGVTTLPGRKGNPSPIFGFPPCEDRRRFSGVNLAIFRRQLLAPQCRSGLPGREFRRRRLGPISLLRSLGQQRGHWLWRADLARTIGLLFSDLLAPAHRSSLRVETSKVLLPRAWCAWCLG